MIWLPFKKSGKNLLGIDIGTSAIKIVETSGRLERPKLENYGSMSAQEISGKPFRSLEKNSLLLSSFDISQAIKAILEEAKVSTKRVAFSIPDFSSFFTNIELPPMAEDEISKAVNFEARRHIPIPPSEAVMDWMIIEGKPFGKKRTKIKVLLVAVPREVINQYQEIAKLTGLELQSLEAEVFALKRALIREEQGLIALIDIGAQSTTISLIDKGILKLSHSFDFASNQLTGSVAQSLNIDFQKAEDLKNKEGLKPKNIADILFPSLDSILAEIKKTVQNFSQTEGQEPGLYILAGGAALLPGLKEYFQSSLNKKVIVADPFADMIYSSVLDPILKEIGPAFAIAVGLSLRGLK